MSKSKEFFARVVAENQNQRWEIHDAEVGAVRLYNGRKVKAFPPCSESQSIEKLYTEILIDSIIGVWLDEAFLK